jgi:hypothetical protein
MVTSIQDSQVQGLGDGELLSRTIGGWTPFFRPGPEGASEGRGAGGCLAEGGECERKRTWPKEESASARGRGRRSEVRVQGGVAEGKECEWHLRNPNGESSVARRFPIPWQGA